jgi:hypothetical protein
MNTMKHPAVTADMTRGPEPPIPTCSETAEFLDWLQPCRGLEVHQASAVRVTELTLQDFVAEHGRPRGRGLRLAGPTTAMWWPGLYVQDFGDYRLLYAESGNR